MRKWVVGFLAAYFAGGLLMLLQPEMETFPVFSWFLFARVPQCGSQYALLLHEVNGQKLDLPRLYQQGGSLVPEPHSVTVFKLTQQLGAAVEKNLPEQNRFRALLETHLPPQTKYQLVKLNADPIVRWKTGQYKIIKHFDAFWTTGGGPSPSTGTNAGLPPLQNESGRLGSGRFGAQEGTK